MGCDIEKTRQIRLCPKKKETLAVYQDTSLTREQNAETSLEEDGNKQKSYCNTLFQKSTFCAKIGYFIQSTKYLNFQDQKSRD